MQGLFLSAQAGVGLHMHACLRFRYSKCFRHSNKRAQHYIVSQKSGLHYLAVC